MIHHVLGLFGDDRPHRFRQDGTGPPPSSNSPRGLQTSHRSRQGGHYPVDTRSPGGRGQRDGRPGQRSQQRAPPTRTAEPASESRACRMIRRTTEAKSQARRGWVAEHVKLSRRYWPPKSRGMRPEWERKPPAGRYYQFLTVHAFCICDKVHIIESNECWGCGMGELSTCW